MRSNREQRAADLFAHAVSNANLRRGWCPSYAAARIVEAYSLTGRLDGAAMTIARLALIEGIADAERLYLDRTSVVTRARIMLRALGALDSGDRFAAEALALQAMWARPDPSTRRKPVHA